MNIEIPFVFLSLLLLGAFHGINPGMGWLFAVALGLQERRRAAVWRTLLPLAAGHALAIAVAVAVAWLIGIAIPLGVLKWAIAGLLFLLGISRLVRHRHPRFGGMRVNMRQLTIWSFLMASAHGAGLMVIPVLLGTAVISTPDNADAATATHVHAAGASISATPAVSVDGHAGHAGTAVEPAGPERGHAGHRSLADGLPSGPLAGLLATLVHTLGYLLVIGFVAVLVYEKFGLRLLRSAWVNLDLIWAATLIATSVLTLVVH